MANWKFWQRSSTASADTELPPEVQEYYESTRRGRKGVAILLSLATIVITLLLAAVLYFSGRYLWRTFVDNDDQPETTEQTEVAPTQPPAEEPTDTGTSSDSTDTPSDTSTDTDVPESLPSDSNDSEENSSSSSSSSTSDDSSGKETTTKEVPDTGPGEVFLVAIFAAVMSGVGYELYGNRKKSSPK